MNTDAIEFGSTLLGDDGLLHTSARMPLSKIRPAVYNPPDRTKDIQKSVLSKSIADIGQVTLVTVVKDEDNKNMYILVDGHRRFTSAEAAGRTTVMVDILEGVSGDEAYAAINGCAVKHSGNHYLRVWLKRPDAVNDKYRNDFKRMRMFLGEDVTKYLGEGTSKGCYRSFEAIRKFANHLNRDFIGLEKKPAMPDNVLMMDTAIWAMEAGYTIGYRDKKLVDAVTPKELKEMIDGFKKQRKAA